MLSKHMTTISHFRALLALLFFVSGIKGFVLSSPTHHAQTVGPKMGPPDDEATPGRIAEPRAHRWGTTPLSSESTSILEKPDTEWEGEEEDAIIGDEEPKPKNQIVISSEIKLPFSPEVAYDAYSDLPRQPMWSYWLRSVEYTTPDQKETLWKMKRFLGVSYSWRAQTRQLERPHLIAWESTKGVKNYGRVDFTPLSNDETLMKLSLSFVVPRVVSRMVGKSNRIARFVKVRLVQSSLKKFRNIVMEAEGIETTDAGEEDEEPTNVEDLESIEL